MKLRKIFISNMKKTTKKNKNMKKIILTLFAVLLTISSVFSGNWIGETKKDLLNTIKKQAYDIQIGKKAEDGDYTIVAKFQSNTIHYTFSKENICYFYVVVEKYYLDNFVGMANYYDERFLRAFDSKTEVWKEYKGDYIVYRWLVRDINGGTQYTIFLTKENYDNNKYIYLKKMLGSSDESTE